MFKGFQIQTTPKSKMSQEGEEEGEEGVGNEVHLSLPCGRPKSFQAPENLYSHTKRYKLL